MTTDQLNEIELINWISKSENKQLGTFKQHLDKSVSSLQLSNANPKKHGDIYLVKKIANVMGGFIYKAKGCYYGKIIPMLVGVSTDDKICILVELKKYGKSWQIDLTVASDDNPIPAYKVYAAFIRLGNTLVSGSEQSIGGKMIWTKLSKERGITVHGWDSAKKQALNIGDNPDDDAYTHASNEDILGRVHGLSDKMSDSSFTPEQKDKIRKEYQDEIADLKYIRKKIVIVAAPTE